MSRHAIIIGTCTDISGIEWEIHETRPTPHGFPLHLGWPKGEPRGRGGRGVATILTQPLCDYLQSTPRPRDIILPIRKTAIKRLRSLIGLKWSYAAWWADRTDDLLTLTLEEFCHRHGGATSAASIQRDLARQKLPTGP
jgi:hypothetical protein